MNAVHQRLSYDEPIIDGLQMEVTAHTTRIAALESKLETITKTLAAIMLELESLRKPEPREPIERIEIDRRHLPPTRIPSFSPIVNPIQPKTTPELEAIQEFEINSGTPQPNLPGRLFPDPQTTNEGDK